MRHVTTRSQHSALAQASVNIQRWQDTTRTFTSDELSVEEPLEIRLVDTDGPHPLAVIMRTPGHDHELALGFLFTEGLVRASTDVLRLGAGSDADGLPSPNTLDIVAGEGLARRVAEGGYSRQFVVNTSCGVCGKNTVAEVCATLASLALRPGVISASVLYALPDRLRQGQTVFAATGGLHAAALFAFDGELGAAREDVGRHNAVDKLIGLAVIEDMVPLSTSVLVVSGRLSYEIVLKAFAAGIPVVAGVSAPSSLAVELAHAAGITLVGFLRGHTMNVYTHPERVAER